MSNSDRTLRDKINRNLSKMIDMAGRRIINAGNSKNLQDYVTRAELLAAQASAVTFPTSFSDTFLTSGELINAGGTQQTISHQWMVCTAKHNFSTAVYSAAAALINSNPADGGANNLIWQVEGPASATFIPQVFLIPYSIIPGIYGLTQFSQCTFVNGTQSSGAGVGVCLIGNRTTGYFLRNTNAPGLTRQEVYRLNDGAATLIGNVDAANALPNNTIVRISADMSTANQVTIRVSKNGTLASTFVDNVTGGNLQKQLNGVGVPGLVGDQPWTAAGGQNWKNFSCGLGL